ncbi:MAG: 2-oxo acid dehydrogenase subunit E2 [Nitrososphaerota archaeon]|nr:2-oxo acid dehydrogenase subunit E2 [Nitrososphaerota archaeon]
MPPYEFKLPDVGEGVAEGEVLKWLVSEGDFIKEDQPLVEVMTDKVNVEIASPKSGKIARILAKVGQIVKVGTSIVVFDIDDEPGPQKSSLEDSPATATSVATPEVALSEANVLATPATRKLANDLGVDLSAVTGTGPRGRITPDDVKSFAQSHVSTSLSVSSSSMQDEERVPLRGLRKIIAERMSKSAHMAAQVTHVDECDVTELALLRSHLNSESGSGVKITFLPLLIRAVIPALKEYPYVNALFDDDKQEIVLKKTYNIGIATDTEQGLIVPVIKDADKKDVYELAFEIDNLVTRGRAGKLSLDDVRGSTFTLTNVGAIGGLYSTPLVYYPEVAIIGIQRIVKRPVVRNDSIVARDMMNLSLSFDHRAIDGAYAARFLNRIIREIENPASLALS